MVPPVVLVYSPMNTSSLYHVISTINLLSSHLYLNLANLEDPSFLTLFFPAELAHGCR